MKIFDSGQDTNWSGSGYEIYNGAIKARTGVNIGQHISIESGHYEIGIICKNITGNGLFRVCISDGDDGVVLDEKIKASSGGWSTFNSRFKSNGGLYFINIYRDSYDFGTIEIGKIFIKKERSKGRVVSKNRSKNSGKIEQIFIKNNIKVAVIVPYKIFGGAEVYLREYFKKSMKISNLSVVFLYFGKNNMEESLNVDNIFHKTILSEEHLKLNLKTNNYTSVIFYNSYNIYNILNNLKKENMINSNIIEIYHSDFQWNDSISSHKSRENVDRIIRVSSSLCNDIEGVSIDKIFTIPMGIDLDRFKKRNSNLVRKKLLLPTDKKIIGTVSRLSDEKNIDYIISLSLLKKDCIFIVVGDGPKREYFKEKVKMTGSTARFVGYSSSPELYYSSFDAFILPSKMEGVPISIMEAMASENPVFCTNVGRVGDLIKDSETGFFLTMNPQVDVELIIKNLKNQYIINNAKKKILEKYNLESNFDRFINSILFFGKYYEINKNSFDIISGEYI